MNKIILTFLFVIGILAFSSTVEARWGGSSFMEAPASSGSISGLSKGCDVLAVYASTDVEVSGAWFQLVATAPSVNNTTYGMFSAADHRSPALFFPSTATSTNWALPIYKVLDYGENGISFSSAPYIHKSAATSGQARRVWLEIKQ